MRSLALKAALATAILLGSGAPALAYYPDDHVWDREYQSGVEWTYPVHRKAVPWISSVAWRDRYPTAPTWWSTYQPASYTGWYDWRGTNAYTAANYYGNYGNYGNYGSYRNYGNTAAQAAAIASAVKNSGYGYYGAGYTPVNANWASYAPNQANAWDNVPWNVSWWNGSAQPVTNAGYYKAVFGSNTNPYSNTRLNQELHAAAAYGDLGRVQALVGAGADIHARDWEGYTPLTWAAQHGRTDVVNYLLSRFAQPNAVDRWGYTPLMWAVQQGHTTVAAMLLAKGANARASTPYGVTPQVLATYAAGGASRGLIEAALAGRRIDYMAYYKGSGNAGFVAPTPTFQYVPQPTFTTVPQPAYTAPQSFAPQSGTTQANVAGAMAPQPMALAGNPAMTTVNSLAATAPRAMINPAEGWAKLAALGANFGNDFKGFLSESTSGGIGLNTLGAFMGGDMEIGKNLSVLFGKLAKDRDLKAARTDLDAAKPGVKSTSRFSKYVTDLDATLSAMGF
jgi:hypothetical protein